MSVIPGFTSASVSALALLGLALPVLATDGATPTVAGPAGEPYRDKYPCTREYRLPELLRGADGKPVDTPAAWLARRGELLELFRKEVYGRSPGRPEKLSFELIQRDDHAMGGKATLKRVMIKSQQQGREHQFVLTLFLPHRSTPAPVFLLLNNREFEVTDPTRAVKSGFWPAEEVVNRGYGIAAIQLGELAPDNAEHYREGVIRLFEEVAASPAPDAWRTIGAWAWGASRAMDYLQTDSDVNAKQVALLGHSRGGKTALWAGAQDERFALVISNESGRTGASLTRRASGETVTKINAQFPYWFCGNYHQYNDREDALPVDQHMLIALIAPRPVCVASAADDWWADPRGEFISLAHASEVYRLFGSPAIDPAAMPPLDTPRNWGLQAYHIRRGEHNLTPYDWGCYMDFADSLWKARR
jgi:(4-O-methyl)-D-glucuronate---lignin esterase